MEQHWPKAVRVLPAGDNVVALPLNNSETLIAAPPKRASNDLSDFVSASERDYQELVKNSGGYDCWGSQRSG